jgi:hypothetical protein
LTTEQITRVIEAFDKNIDAYKCWRANDFMLELFARCESWVGELENAWVRLYDSFYDSSSSLSAYIGRLLPAIESRYPEETKAIALEHQQQNQQRKQQLENDIW